MIYLIWSIINGIIILYFFYLIIGFIVKGKKIFKSRFKVISLIVIVSGAIQIISALTSEKSSNRIIISENHIKTNYSKIKRVVLEETLTLDINLLLKYTINKSKYVPLESTSSLTGFVSGYVWEFKSININNYKLSENIEYTANGILKWNFFGVTVYNQYKEYTGRIE